jgi:hypothetical protein
LPLASNPRRRTAQDRERRRQNPCAARQGRGRTKGLLQAGAKEDVVAQDETGRLAADESGADTERICEAAGLGLLRIGKAKTPLRTISEQPLNKGRSSRADDMTSRIQYMSMERG